MDHSGEFKPSTAGPLNPSDDGFSLAPYWTIWSHPRKTIRRIVTKDPKSHVTVLVVLSGVTECLARMSGRNIGDRLSLAGILAAAFLVAPVGAIFSVWLYSHLTRISGRWLKGQAGYGEIKPAIAWASLPTATGILLWIPLLLLVGREMFTEATPHLDAHTSLTIVVVVSLLILMTLNIWTAVLLCNTIAEVQGFRSAWKGLANVLLGGAILLVPIIFIALIAHVTFPREAPESLLGKKVMTSKWHVEVLKNDEIVRRLPIAEVLTVTKEDGDLLWFNDTVGGWVKRSDVVDYEKAIDYFTRQIEESPTSVNFRDRAEARRARLELDSALDDLNTAIRLNASDDTAYNARGLVWDDKGEYDNAIADFDKAIRLDPKFVQAYANRGCAKRNKGENKGAIEDFTKSIRLDPKNAVVYCHRGLTWQNLGEYEKAIADYDEAIRRDPTMVDAYFNRGSCWDSLGEFEKAIADCSKAIELNPNDAEAYSDFGTAWYHKGEFERAIAQYNEAIRLDPQFAVAYYNRGSAWYYLDEYEKAILDFSQAIKLDPKFHKAYHSRGHAYEELGKLQQAIADYRESLRLDPNDAEDHDHLAWLLATSLDAECRDGKLAVEYATMACKLSNWANAGFLDTLAAAHAESGDFVEAIEVQEKAIAAAEENEREFYESRLTLYRSGVTFRDEE